MLEASILKMRPSDARAALGISIHELARLADVSIQTVVNAEHGRVIQRLKAHALLKALNEQRATHNEPPLHIDELDWKIQGEG